MGQKRCRYCGRVLDSFAETCDYCGKYLLKERDNTNIFCTKCKSPVNTDDNFCQNCGAIFNIVPQDIDYDKPVKHNINGIPYNIGIFLKAIAASVAITVFFTSGKDSTLAQNFILGGIAFIVAEVFLYIYFLPSIIAIENNNRNVFFIYILNLILGVTIIGWFIAFGMALNSDKKDS